jgi:diacylglycerol kinase (ATP)
MKDFGLKRLYQSFNYAKEGLVYAFTHEQNIVLHAISTFLVILISYFLELSLIEFSIIIILIGLVVATELINTSIEALVDLVSPEYHKLAKVAKDTAAASVLVFSLTALIAGAIIIIPNILKFM